MHFQPTICRLLLPNGVSSDCTVYCRFKSWSGSLWTLFLCSWIRHASPTVSISCMNTLCITLSLDVANGVKWMLEIERARWNDLKVFKFLDHWRSSTWFHNCAVLQKMELSTIKCEISWTTKFFPFNDGAIILFDYIFDSRWLEKWLPENCCGLLH